MLDRHLRHRYAIPVAALFAQQEAIERRAFQRLRGAAAAKAILALVADRIWIGGYYDFQKLLPGLLEEVHPTMMPRISRTLFGMSSNNFAALGKPQTTPLSLRPTTNTPPSALAKPQIHLR